MGVSASGKTTVGEALGERLQWAFEDGDAWHSAANIAKMKSGQELTDEDRAPWLQSLNQAMRNWSASGRNVVLACSALKASYREVLRSGMALESARFVYLKGTFEAFRQRIEARQGHFMPESLLQSQFKTLEEPNASEALIVDAAVPVAEIVEAIVGGLHLQTRE